MGTRVPQTVGSQPPRAEHVSAQSSAQASAQGSHCFFPPGPLLSPFVTSLWIHRSVGHARSRVLPTGTAQLIVDLSGDGLCVPDLGDLPDTPHLSSSVTRDRFRDSFPALLHGPDSRAFALETDRHLFQVGVDFKPGGVYPFFAPPARLLENAHLSLDALWGRQAVADLRDRLAEAPTLEECARLLEHVLLRQLVRPLQCHPAVALALRVLSGPPHTPLEGAGATDAAWVQVSQVAAAAGLSSGHFARLFQEEVGLTPKRFARVRRFRSVLQRARMEQVEQVEQVEQQVRWAQIALNCGYYDQAHLINDFQTFAGVSPSAYLRARSAHSPATLLLAE
jgi:AraC-like DNA-binding protein